MRRIVIVLEELEEGGQWQVSSEEIPTLDMNCDDLAEAYVTLSDFLYEEAVSMG